MKNIEGEIRIKEDGIRRKAISSKSEWFNTESVIITVYDYYISFKKPTLDYTGRVYIPRLDGYDYVIKYTDYLPLGRFKFDEDSNEDEIIINL